MTFQTCRWNNHALHLSLNRVRLSITLEGDAAPRVYNYDLSGRPWNIYEEGIIYLRGLDGKVVAKWTDLAEGRGRRWLSAAEAADLIHRSSAVAEALLRDQQIGRLELQLDPDLMNTLDAAARFEYARAEQEVARFHEIYSPVGILPPDQYQAVLLQATEGCSFNACTFCEFYKGRRFHIKSEHEFELHVRAVREFLGAGLSLRRTIFLGDANALVVPTERLLSLMEIAGESFDVRALGGYYAFLDGFSGEKKSSREYQRLREAGLKRVYIGLESGHDPLLRYLNKPGSAQDALHAIRKMKTGELPVGVIVLLGAGGAQFSEGHLRDTVQLINAMQLDYHDQIYFSELIEFEEMAYARDAFRDEIDPLEPEALIHQAEQIQAGLEFSPVRGTPHISRYDIREFVY